MNKGMPDIQPTRPEMFEQFGMTLLETLLAMTMLVVFTGVVAVVMQFTLRFFTTAESGEQNEFDVSNGCSSIINRFSWRWMGLLRFCLSRGSA